MHSRSRIRSVFDAIAGVGFIAAVLVGVFLIVLLGDRARGEAGADDLSSAVAAAPTTTATTSQAALPSGLESTFTMPPPAATLNPLPPVQTTAPSTRATARPPKPTGDPRPEGTPHYHRASGRIGETIVNGDVSIRVERAEIPATYDYGLCSRVETGYTEFLAFAITESWTRWTSMDWVFEMSNTEPMTHWIETVPDYGNGATTVLVVCHRPGTSSTITIWSGPLEHTDVSEEYQWTIR